MKARSRVATEQALHRYHLEPRIHAANTRGIEGFHFRFWVLAIATAVCLSGTWALLNRGNNAAKFRVRTSDNVTASPGTFMDRDQNQNKYIPPFILMYVLGGTCHHGH
jgi:hypothetical protein